ncbi:MAG: NAD(P)/FAD-dependent oxidoreductase [Mycobacteriales bacterium]
MRVRTAYNRADHIVIVGTGPAGLSAAEELRAREFHGQITMIGDEPPYDRTGLSKGILTGHQKPKDLRMPGVDELDVTWRIGQRAVRLDAHSRRVFTDTNDVYHYDGLVIASGARPVMPEGWPVNAPGVHLLHRVEQSLALRRDLRDADRVAIVGGGLTGCEVACAVHKMAREAVIINSKRALLSNVLGEPVGRLVTEAHQRAGIGMRLGRRVAAIEQRRRERWRLRLTDGDVVNADVVVVTSGDKPDTEWLEGSGLDISDGVRCDEMLRALTPDGIIVPGVVVAGVIARWPNLRYSRRPVRTGHWIAALEQGQAAARTLLGGDHMGGRPFTLLPRFWSDQLGLRIEVSGLVGPEATVSLTALRPARKAVAQAGVLAHFHQENRLVGLVAVNAPRAFTAATRALLADPTEPLIAAAIALRNHAGAAPARALTAT